MDHLPRRAEESFKQQIRSGQRKNRKRPGNLREQIDPVVVRWAIEARLESNKVPKEKWTEMFQQYQKDQMKLYPKSMYPTPQVDDSKNVNPSPKRRMTLAKHVKMYPTPQRSDHLANQSETLKAWKKRATEKKKQGINLQFALRHAVQMYPTPTVDCEEGGQQSERVERTKSGAFILRKKNKPESTFGAKLSDAMLYLEKNKMLPTPTVNDSKNNAGPSQYKRKGTNLNVAVGGKLNPTFVEFLMGFPMDWTKVELTESKPSATQLSPK
jgi:hypothetical protein